MHEWGSWNNGIITKLADIIKEPEVKPQEEPKKEVTEIKPIVKAINPNTSDNSNINILIIITSFSLKVYYH